jgi:tRNA pseudouridine38-40 synthase
VSTALNQVVHFDAPVERDEFSWVRGTNRFLPEDIAVQWAQVVPPDFHARNAARGRRYAFLLRESPVRPAIEAGLCGWVFRPLDVAAMRESAQTLLGEHDFSSFRSSQCQALTPVKEVRRIDIAQIGDYWRFDFEASAFLHHMVRNIMGALVAIGSGNHPSSWMAELLAHRRRTLAPPTFPAAGLYFVGPRYDAHLAIPERTSATTGCPRCLRAIRDRTKASRARSDTQPHRPPCRPPSEPGSRSAASPGRRMSTRPWPPAPTRSASCSTKRARATCRSTACASWRAGCRPS